MKLKNKIIILGIFTFCLLVSNQAFASITDGTIDSTDRYAWGENVGFIDFGSTAGDVHITDTVLSGSAYGENIGWINLSGVTNNNEGTLSGYAWGENVGFIDFSKVTIGTDGVFSGSAYGENIGWITFGTTYNKVQTDWRPTSSRPQQTSSTGSSAQSRYNYLISMGNIKTAEELKKEFPNQIVSSTVSTSASSAIGKNITRTLKLKTPQMKGDDVKSLQIYLNTHSYNSGIADGIFGPKTKKAVVSFQLANQLKGDGIVGPLTRNKLIN